jgi:hypothetical protein
VGGDGRIASLYAGTGLKEATRCRCWSVTSTTAPSPTIRR